MPFIDWVEDEDAQGQVAKVYNAWKAANPERQRIPEILKCFSLRPDLMRALLGYVYPLHFTDGHLKRRIKEMIATLVSGLNQCPY